MTQYVLAAASFFDFSFVTNLAKNVYKAIERNRKTRQTYNELNSLSNRELQDIGITRGDIYKIAMDCNYKPLRGNV
tara:strand:+ start:141 stop:368 length:228 start_codon:yes stop_codon:yes gene_type:complete